MDLVYFSEQGITWCLEIKWTNRFYDRPNELDSLIKFISKHPAIKTPRITTIDKRGTKIVNNISMTFIEASIYAYQVGRNIMSNLDIHQRFP